uniref:Uncharacterized protein n=1 Tax=Oryza nivara TaxID=4536 RepID=A0A0E0G7W7_ORYNI
MAAAATRGEEAAGSRLRDGVAALPRRGQLVAGGDNDKNERVYTLYLETGWKAGTDAAVDVEPAAADGSGFAVGDLEWWGGLMGAGHDYYVRAAAPPSLRHRTPTDAASPCRAFIFSRVSAAAASPTGHRTSSRQRPPSHRRPA